MVDTLMFDALDRQILAALQVDGRAPFRRVADVLGTSEHTVARRYAKMRSTGRARVLGLTDPKRLGETSWFVRVRTTPEAAGRIAEAMARRPDTAWVSITSGGTEIVCSTRSRNAQEPDTLHKLPRTQRVVDVSAHAILHVFHGHATSPLLKTGDLTTEQIHALADDAPPVVTIDGPVALDGVDQALLELLAHDGRAPVEELATRTDTPATTVRRRLTALRGSGVLYFDVDLDLRDAGAVMPALMWLAVSPRDVAAAGEAFAGHPQVAFAAATTGRTNIFVSLVPTDTTALYRYLTGPVATLSGVHDVETAPVIRSVKGAGPVPPGR